MKISISVCTLWQYDYVETVPAPTRVTKLSGFQRSGSEMLDFWKLKKYNKSVKNYFQKKLESADLIYWPRGIQKCNKMSGITDSTKRLWFLEKVFDKPIRCILATGVVENWYRHKQNCRLLCNHNIKSTTKPPQSNGMFIILLVWEQYTCINILTEMQFWLRFDCTKKLVHWSKS